MSDVTGAYRKMAKKVHPDAIGQDDATAFRALNEAYELIKAKHVPKDFIEMGKSIRVYNFMIDILDPISKYSLPRTSDVHPFLEYDVAIILTLNSHGIQGFKDKYVLRLKAGTRLPKKYYVPDLDEFVYVSVDNMWI